MAEENGTQKVEADFTGPTGFGLKLRGVTFDQLVKLLKGIAVFGLLGYVVWMFHDDHKEIADTMGIMTYVISLPQASREALNLNMPAALQDRMRKGKQ